MLYPLKFTPIYMQKIWGGNALKQLYHRETALENIGESWDVSCRSDAMSVVENGSLKGKTFLDIIHTHTEGMLGKHYHSIQDFPLLLKLIDANDDLSIQVHPSDEQAQLIEGQPYGKSEAWYVLAAEKEAALISGFRELVSKADLEAAIMMGKVSDMLHYLPVKAGDVIYIPSGYCHAITKGICVLEIQQNSDTTYRLYDYERLGLDEKPRELHIEKALEVLNFSQDYPANPVNGLPINGDGVQTIYYIASPYFSMIKYTFENPFTMNLTNNAFNIITLVSGNCQVIANNVTTAICAGDTLFIPAEITEIHIDGSGELIRNFAGNQKENFIAPLTEYGYTMNEILQNTIIDQR